MPGRNWPVRLTSTSGMARLRVALQLHSGRMNCGWARLSDTPSRLAPSSTTASTTPTTSSSTRL